MMCAESLRTQAYFDGELDEMSAAAIERHAGRCAQCGELLEELGATRARIRREVPVERTPDFLLARIAATLDAQCAAPDGRTPHGHPAGAGGQTAMPLWRTRAFWAGACSGVDGAGLAAIFAFLLTLPPRADHLADELIAAHLRSLLPAHLIDVESADRHTVKPWFAGRSDVSPMVADFAASGFSLAGGRVDYVGHQRVAVLVYRHGPHVINVFSWRVGGSRLPADRDLDGYHLVYWQTGDFAYGAVSDTGIDELHSLERLMRE